MRSVGAAVFGIAVSLAMWVLLLPWEFSEVAGESGDRYAGRIALVGAGVLSSALLVAIRWPDERCTAYAAASLAAFALLFVWRSVDSETSGANMWPIPFVFAVLPASLAGFAVVSWLRDRHD